MTKPLQSEIRTLDLKLAGNDPYLEKKMKIRGLPGSHWKVLLRLPENDAMLNIKYRGLYLVVTPGQKIRYVSEDVLAASLADTAPPLASKAKGTPWENDLRKILTK